MTSGPLRQLKVLDFSTLLPGPYATMLLADMGAEVLRIESPTRKDLLNELPPHVGKRSAAHLTINRNKKSLTLDLKNSAAPDIVFQLIQSYDVVVEQFRPGVMQRLGLDYETLKAVNPALIYCSITGYGHTGPLKDKAGHDINYLALSGLASYSGRKETGPVLSGTQVADIAGGSHHAVMAIMAAYIERTQTGTGQFLDISMSDAALSLNAMYSAATLAVEQTPQCGHESLNGGLFYDYYATKDGRYFSVGALEPQFVIEFFSKIGHPTWALRAKKPAGKQDKLKADIAKTFAKKTFAEWQVIFADSDCCVEPVLNLDEALNHPHFEQRNMLQDCTLESGQSIRQVAPAIKFSQPFNECTPGPIPGQHSSEILQQLGFEQSHIQQLIKNKVTTQA
ncbi:CaiB/BaiF CoA-transferase family protein [Pleionea sp. CnH1-48]|uniref:CaiB/BaiF CoA transferase family protein n=1 Tax=Pleionea sp. CnH1-48 TaxID=2954494 RepID=UPI0020981F5A|nr:CaiB/BaiF CoA-transferase family protein [Pleionea sp. CnH1-48]MCO7223907.1 CoA transferase [Pleionea sp. CnH1-48]